MNKRTWNLVLWIWVSLPLAGLYLYEAAPLNINPAIINTLMGTFIGAILAFLSNWWLKYESRRKEELVAGMGALFTIRSQFDDFINVRYALRHSMNEMAKEMPDKPEWCYAKPMAFNFNPSNVFDFKSLSFLLLTEAGRSVYQGLQLIERTYLDLMARHTDLNNSAMELQKTTDELFRKYANITTLESMENLLGPELTARVRSHIQAVVIRVDRDEKRYLNIFNELNTVMNQIFGDKVEMAKLFIPEKFRKDNLPSFPIKLRKHLDQIPDDN